MESHTQDESMFVSSCLMPHVECLVVSIVTSRKRSNAVPTPLCAPRDAPVGASKRRMFAVCAASIDTSNLRARARQPTKKGASSIDACTVFFSEYVPSGQHETTHNDDDRTVFSLTPYPKLCRMQQQAKPKWRLQRQPRPPQSCGGYGDARSECSAQYPAY